MSYYKPYNPNPARNRVGDCTARAICKATGNRKQVDTTLFHP